MNEEEINEILKDPNTWEWDGYTYSDMDTKEGWEDEFLKKLKEQTK